MWTLTCFFATLFTLDFVFNQMMGSSISFEIVSMIVR